MQLVSCPDYFSGSAYEKQSGNETTLQPPSEPDWCQSVLLEQGHFTQTFIGVGSDKEVVGNDEQVVDLRGLRMRCRMAK